jgi:2-amino-4-hydroxy-6-hydroxymethyldihydropteridine diphosphokinase
MQVFLGLGSNLDAQKHIDLAIGELTEIYGALRQSKRYKTAAIGFNGPDFVNMVVAFNTGHSVAEVTIEAQGVERRVGRIRESESGTGSRAIDIDLLLFERIATKEPLPQPRTDIRDYAYAALPMADLNPDWRHALIGELNLKDYLETRPFDGQVIELLAD